MSGPQSDDRARSGSETCICGITRNTSGGWFQGRCAPHREQAELPRPSARIKSQHLARPASARRAWERGSPAICREAAAKPVQAASPDTPRPDGFRPAARPIASKLRSHGLRPESKANTSHDSLLPGGRGSVACVWAAIGRSGAKRQQNRHMRYHQKYLGRMVFRAASRPIASKLRSHGLRPESSQHLARFASARAANDRSHAPRGNDHRAASARRAWERGLPAIWREAAAKPAHAVSPDTPRPDGFRAASRPIASKLRSHGLRPESKADTPHDSLLPTRQMIVPTLCVVTIMNRGQVRSFNSHNENGAVFSAHRQPPFKPCRLSSNGHPTSR